ncbi:hypothetical protein [Methanococcoides burtonii]|uniref:hypothetical protein n=1 Tax=Methanococcoides burtonii TaxID=29291 RepID=UPI0012F6FAC7|nr:hypothetical protein [Methanococcoides burtonii]
MSEEQKMFFILEEVKIMCNENCPCWGKNITHPRICPICDYIFKGNGWDGIDAHYKARHEKETGELYKDWWARICSDHKAKR